jgi:hypothetical protein
MDIEDGYLCSLCNREDCHVVRDDFPFVCSKCVQKLLNTERGEIIRIRDLACKRGLHKKADLLESFIK